MSLFSINYVKKQGVQFSHSVVSDSLRPHGLQHRPPCPSPTPGAYSNSCPLSGWCHPTISSSVIPISSHLQSFPASGSFPMSQFFTSISWPKYYSFSFSIRGVWADGNSISTWVSTNAEEARNGKVANQALALKASSVSIPCPFCSYFIGQNKSYDLN